MLKKVHNNGRLLITIPKKKMIPPLLCFLLLKKNTAAGEIKIQDIHIHRYIDYPEISKNTSLIFFN